MSERSPVYDCGVRNYVWPAVVGDATGNAVETNNDIASLSVHDAYVDADSIYRYSIPKMPHDGLKAIHCQ